MIPQKDRIEAAIRHIQTATDVDPWAMELAVDALKAQGTCDDAVSRQTLQKELALYPIDDITSEDEAGYNRAINDVQKMVLHLPSAQPVVKDTNVPNNDDIISRHAVIDRAVTIPMFGRDVKMVAVSEIKNLPSAQPDAIPLEWIAKHLEWLDNCDNDFAQLAKVAIKAMVEIWKKEKT